MGVNETYRGEVGRMYAFGITGGQSVTEMGRCPATMHSAGRVEAAEFNDVVVTVGLVVPWAVVGGSAAFFVKELAVELVALSGELPQAPVAKPRKAKLAKAHTTSLREK